MKAIYKHPLAVGASLLLVMQILLAWDTPRTLEECVKSAALIVRGTVIDKYSVVENDDGDDNIYTYVMLSITEVYLGKLDKDNILIRMRGGSIAGRLSFTEKLFPFDIDEEALLFLKLLDEKANVFEIVNISGKLPIIVDDGIKYCDTSMLRSEGKYSFGPLTRVEDILSTIATITYK